MKKTYVISAYSCRNNQEWEHLGLWDKDYLKSYLRTKTVECFVPFKPTRCNDLCNDSCACYKKQKDDYWKNYIYWRTLHVIKLLKQFLKTKELRFADKFFILEKTNEKV